MLSIWPSHLDRVAGRELLLQPGDDLVDLARDAAEIAALEIGVDLVDRLNVRLVGVGRQRSAGEGRHIAEQARHRISLRREGGADRRIGQRIERGHLRLRGLNRQVIGYPLRRIGPEIRGYLLGRAQADVEVGGDLAGVEAELCRAGAVDRGKERRRIDLLLEMGIGNARDGPDAAPELPRDVQILDAVIADGAHVDLRRHPEIQDLGDHIGSLKIEDVFRKGRRQHLAQLAHIIGGRRVPVLQRHQDHAVIDADRRAVGEGTDYRGAPAGRCCRRSARARSPE